MKKKKSPLKKMSISDATQSVHEIIKLLIADHKLMRTFMSKVKSQKSSKAQSMAAFAKLTKTVQSHVKSEESSLLSLIKDHPKFEDMAVEGIEEHRVHENVLAGIHKLKDKDRKVEQMKIYCEILEHHLDEEEDELFPKFKKYAATSTRKKIGKKFLRVRKKTNKIAKKRGAARFGRKSK
jgi:hemerythrin superfamily protein